MIDNTAPSRHCVECGLEMTHGEAGCFTVCSLVDAARVFATKSDEAWAAEVVALKQALALCREALEMPLPASNDLDAEEKYLDTTVRALAAIREVGL